MSGIVAPCSLLSVPFFFFCFRRVVCAEPYSCCFHLSAIEVLWRACSFVVGCLLQGSRTDTRLDIFRTRDGFGANR